MAAGWFCEKSGWIGKVEDVKPVLLKKIGFQPAFSVMAAGWFCEKSGWIGKVEDVKPVPLKIKIKMDFNQQPFWREFFLPGWIVK